MAKAQATTIDIKSKAQGILKEAIADEILSPGHLLELTATGYRKNTIVPTDVLTDVGPLVALEQDLIGRGINDAYSAGETVRSSSFTRGHEILLRVADGAPAIAVGDSLQPVSGGTVAKVTTGAAIARALEALTNTSGNELFIKVEVL